MKLINQEEIDRRAASKFTLKESEIYRIEGFKKEFRRVLTDLKNQELAARNRKDMQGEVDPLDHALSYNLVVHIMHEMEFLKPKLSVEQENQITDLYVLFKCNKDKQILAENLQNILMVISGQRNPSIEEPVNDEPRSQHWEECGAYD